MIDTKIATTSLGTWPALGWPFGWRSAHCARRARLACPQEASLLDLVALSTVADTGWRGPRHGPGKAQSRPRLGLQHLIQVAGLRIGALDAMRVVFALMPRLNTADRLENTRAAYDLLMCENPTQVAVLAAQLDRQNRER